MKIAVGLSGGVDSSVAALLLKKAGHDVVALFMQNWHDTTGTLEGDCPWEEDLTIAELVARQLNIPFHFVDLSKTYRERVIDYMFDEYSRGRTPNPDVMCNREIKFNAFMQEAFNLGADLVATGHYCRKSQSVDSRGEIIYSLLAGRDNNKDQSYFLCQLTQLQLSKAIFPIGELTKPEVRQLAFEAALPSADKKDSQGICFVGKVDLPLFLQQKLSPKEGRVVEIFKDHYINSIHRAESSIEELVSPFFYNPTDGKVIGSHNGAHFYTVGQRKGLNIGGHIDPLFIIATDIENNIIYVGEGQEHPGLYRRGVFVEKRDIHWIRVDLAMSTGEQRDYLVRIRYRQPLQKARLYMESAGLYIIFEEPQRGVTPGQFAAWYCCEELLGSGAISR